MANPAFSLQLLAVLRGPTQTTLAQSLHWVWRRRSRLNSSNKMIPMIKSLVSKRPLLAVTAVASLLTAQNVSAVPGYVSSVPNGSVNSCSTCHTSPPTRNAFGNSFAATHTWSPALAALDSDGDGFSNGQELGDPRGVWTPGAALPIPGAQVTLPGDATSKPTLTAPPITLSSPTNLATVASTYLGPLTATPGNPAAITKVQFYSGTNLLGTDTNSPFTLPVSLFAGSYSLTVKATDYLGAVGTSTATILTVTPPAPASLGSLSVSGNQIQMKIVGATNATYQIMFSTNLTSWSPLSLVVLTNGTILLNDPWTNGQRFYRAMGQ